jgi:transmembrane sensor
MQKDQFSGNSSDIRSEACAWIAQLETGELTRADIDAFREWTQRSPRHAAEVRKLAHLSADLNVLTGLAGPMKAAAAKYGGVVQPRRRLQGTGLAWLSASAMAGVLAVVVFLMKPFAATQAPEWPLALATGVGEYREHRLPDGSVLALNTDTQLKVTFTTDRREIILSKGEALFTVARNPQKPFVVYAGDKSVEAVGTVFLVRNDRQTFEVAVTEGRVKLDRVPAPPNAGTTVAGGPNPTSPVDLQARAPLQPEESGGPEAVSEPVLLDAGQHITLQVQNTAGVPAMPAIEVISPVDLRRKLAWRDGLLDFSDTPLEEVVREVSRYTTTRIEIADPTLAEIRFGGVFRAGDTEPLFRALESAYDIRAEYINQDTVRLTRSAFE